MIKKQQNTYYTTISRFELSIGANIKTVASILVHSGLVHTEKYTRAVYSLKQAAIDSMPSLEL